MAPTFSKIMDLSDEVIIIILENKCLHYRNVINFQSTCERFHQLKFNKQFWEKKYYHSNKIWYDAEKRKRNPDHINFKELIDKSIQCMKDLQGYRSLMINDNISYINKKRMDDLLSSIAKNSDIYYLILNDISINWAQSVRNDNDYSNMNAYYTFHQQLRQYRFMYKHEKFVEMPQEKQIIERLVTILAQYHFPFVSYSTINKWLDNIVQEVLSCINNKYSTHSIFSTSRENFSLWRDFNIECNYWNCIETTEIFEILQEFIYYSDSIPTKLYELWHALNLPKIYQNIVYQNVYVENDFSQSYILGILFNSIARRLGVYCILGTSFVPGIESRVVTLLWMPEDELINLDNAACVRLQDRCVNLDPTIVVTIKDGRFFEKMKATYSRKYYLREAMEILHTFVRLRFGIDDIWIVEILINIIGRNYSDTKGIRVNSYNTRTYKLQFTRKRTHEIKFAIGMIVAHSSEQERNPDHIGIIIGWDYSCDRLNRENFSRCMFPHLYGQSSHEHFCCCRRKSPHYRILAHYNIICTVPQDKIRPCPPKPIDNIEIALYFSGFEGTHYVANKILKREYPSDTTACRKILAQQRNS